MVISGIAEEGERAQKAMAMEPERSKPLHNFSMPWLKWGNQKFLRCMKVNSTGEVSAVDHRRSITAFESDKSLNGYRYRDSDSEKKRKYLNASESLKKSPVPVRKLNIDNPDEDDDGGIEAVREKLMFDLKTAADRMKVAILREGEEEEEESVTTAAAAAARPWNLRTRRAACKAPNVNGENTKFEDKKASFSPPRTESPLKSSRLRGVGVAGNGTEKKERAKFKVPLSRKEVEEDYMAMLGERPPRRPKKRAKIVQKQLDFLFPGLWLTEVTPDIYKVPELPDSGKR